MVIMENYYSPDHIQELWLKIDQLHMRYLEMEESSEKLNERTNLEECIAEFLCVVSPKQKFVLSETEQVLFLSATHKKDFSGYRAATGWNALQMYAGNLWMQPWRKEYRQIKLYCGFYKHQIEANLVGAEKIFEIMGYRHVGNGVLALDGPVCPDRVIAISRDCLIAYVECQILKHIWEEISAVVNISWLEILEHRRNYTGSPDECIKNLIYKYSQKPNVETTRNFHNDYYDHKYQSTAPNNQIPILVGHNFVSTANHNHVALPLPAAPCCMAPSNGYPNTYSTYGYASCSAHIPVIKQNISPIVQNGYHFGNGSSLPTYPVPTGQLIEIESRNGFDTFDGGSSSKPRKSRTISNITHENGRIDVPQDDLAFRDDAKQDIEEDWSYVYRNLEKQGYTKDLGERGDILGLTTNDKEKKHNKEHKKVKSTNLDEAMNKLTVNNRPLKMTEALEHMEQRPMEKIHAQPRERKKSQDSTYENVTSNIEVTKAAKQPVKSNGGHSKSLSKEQSEVTSSVKVEDKKSKEKEKCSSAKWECNSCTYINENNGDICEMCSKSRNIIQDQPIEVGGAECSKCTLVNPRSAKTCQACSTSLKDSPTYI